MVGYSSSSSSSSSDVMRLLYSMIAVSIVVLASESLLVEGRLTAESFRQLSEEHYLSSSLGRRSHARDSSSSSSTDVTKWAVLVAGSNGYENYRHQADICHAYQVLKKGGLKDENIVVMMYDDIANSDENPNKGVIVNRPGGENVYKGVPKDYTGNAVTAKNLLAVILGDKKGVQGGNGKVINSGPNDHVFIYYSDHGSPGFLSMPVGDDLSAKEFVNTLTKKHEMGTYKNMVIYIEACEAGSIFDGLLPKNTNIYVTTASNPTESSYATYCPGTDTTVPDKYQTCLGDLYSVAWMEDSDKQNRMRETLEKQYEVVKKRTISAKDYGSHVMLYGDVNMGDEILDSYIGDDSSTTAHGKHPHSSIMAAENEEEEEDMSRVPLVAVDQREADILYLRQKVRRAPLGSQQKVKAQKVLDEAIAHRQHVDRTVVEIGKQLFGAGKGAQVMKTVRPAGQPLVDDWDCLKSMAATYKEHCGSLSSYGMKYMRAFANMCNLGIRAHQMAKASSQACKKTTA